MFSFELKTHIWALLNPLFAVIPVHEEELLDIATHGPYLPQKGGREIQTERWYITGAREDQPHPSNLSKALGKLNKPRRNRGGEEEHERRSGENLISSFFSPFHFFLWRGRLCPGRLPGNSAVRRIVCLL